MKKKKEKKQINKKTLIKILAVILAICILTSGIILTVVAFKNSGTFLRNKVYAKTEHFDINGAMMQYFMYETYNSFLEYFGSYVANMNLDTTKSLKKQVFDTDGDDVIYWFDYFKNETKTYLDELLYLCEGAYENNITLTDEEKQICIDRAKLFNLKKYGTGVNANDIASCLELTILANKYKAMIYENITVTDEEIDTYLLEHQDEYLYGHYREIEIPYTDSTYRKIEDRVDKLRKVTNDEDFVRLLTEFNTIEGMQEPEKTAQSTLKSNLRNDIAFDDDVVEKIFSGVEGLTIVIQGADSFYVYFVVEKPSYDSTKTVNVRQLLVNSNQYTNLDTAKLWANNILDLYNNDANEETFKKLVLQYSSEESTLYSYGLYRDSKPSELLPNLSTWAYEENRQPGDTTIIASEYGYHIMYFIGDGNFAFYGDVLDILEYQKYDEILSVMKSKTDIEYFENNINNIAI